MELVRFRAETDDVLQSHLESRPSNACYTSKTIQNELIDVIGKHLRSQIVAEVQKAKFFSVIEEQTSPTWNDVQYRYAMF